MFAITHKKKKQKAKKKFKKIGFIRFNAYIWHVLEVFI